MQPVMANGKLPDSFGFSSCIHLGKTTESDWKREAKPET